MKVTIDTDRRNICLHDGTTIPLYSDEGFYLLSEIWLKIAWNQKYVYTFTWLGVPVIQLPDDILRYQEAVFTIKPDIIIETGVAHGGSLVYSATLCKAMGRGRVIGVDIEIRPQNRLRLESHSLSPLITLVEGSSTAPEIIERVRQLARTGEKVLVVLDSNHSYAHVSAELEAYAPLVTPGSYIIVTDGSMRELADAPRGQPSWTTDNPARAAQDFVAKTPQYTIEEPVWPFNESTLRRGPTLWPSAWVKRLA